MCRAVLQFLRLGRKGYTAIVHNMKTVSTYLAKEIAAMGTPPIWHHISSS